MCTAGQRVSLTINGPGPSFFFFFLHSFLFSSSSFSSLSFSLLFPLSPSPSSLPPPRIPSSLSAPSYLPPPPSFLLSPPPPPPPIIPLCPPPHDFDNEAMSGNAYTYFQRQIPQAILIISHQFYSWPLCRFSLLSFYLSVFSMLFSFPFISLLPSYYLYQLPLLYAFLPWFLYLFLFSLWVSLSIPFCFHYLLCLFT